MDEDFTDEMKDIEDQKQKTIISKTSELEYVKKELESTRSALKKTEEQLYKTKNELQKTKKQYLREKAFTEAMVESLHGYLYVYNDKGQLIRWNKKHEIMTGFTAEELKDKTMADWFDGEDALRVKKAVDEVFETGYGQVEADLITKSGKKIPVRSSGVRLILNGERFFVGVGIDISANRKADEFVRINQARLKSIISILQYQSESMEKFLSNALDQAIKLSSSKIGYIFLYNEESKTFELNAWSRNVMNGCSLPLSDTSCIELNKVGIWGEVVRQRKKIIINDFKNQHKLKKGYPEGHLPLKRFMSIPVFKDNKIVAVVGVANKDIDYTETDVLQMSLMMNVVWKSYEMKKAEEAFRSSELRYKALFQNNHAVMIIVDPETGDIVDANPAACQFYGWTVEELKQKEISEINCLDKEETHEQMKRSALQKKNVFYFKHRIASGEIRDVEVYSGPINIENKRLLYSLVHDITDRVRGDKKIINLLKEKELILKEVHHRIKNNMSTMGSLLFLQSKTLKDPASIEALEDAYGRLTSMTLLYDKLYRAEDFEFVSTDEYLSHLVDDVIALFPGREKVRISKDIETFSMPTKKMQDLGIIVNELLTNIMKYAFEGRVLGIITVQVQLQGDLIKVVIQDDGIGFADSFDFKNSSGFGMMLIDLMTKQLEGTIRIEREKGTKFILEFPK